MNWIVTFIFLGCIYSAQGALRDVIGVCCDMGRQYAAQDGVCSDLEFFPLFDIQEVDRPACIYIATGCCSHETPKLLCEDGLLQRSNYGSCESIQSDNCYEVEKACCNCCELGLMAYHDGAPCEMETLGEFCNHAFQTCCQRAFNEGDVDECSIPSNFGGAGGKCSEKCINVIGDYKCGCGEGKTLAADGHKCVRGNPNNNQRLQPTERPYTDPCDTAPCTQDCRSNTVTYQCSCRSGYRLQSDRATCIREDTGRPDPCETAPCTQDCQSNTVTYQCTCRQGYQLESDGFTCRDTRAPVNPCDTAPCTQDCRSNSVAYQCICRQGYQLESDGFTCSRDTPNPQSVNPCDTAPCTQDCQSNSVTYQCSCRQGYQLERDGFTCSRARAPVDPCETAPCSQNCQNFNNGTYQCTCNHGYQLDTNGFTCRRATTAPADLCTTAPCTDNCFSNGVTYQCSCNQGYLLNDDGVSCRDEDECVTGYYQCGGNERCVNTDGGYRCEQGAQCTEPGYAYSDTAGRCEDINECESDPDICELHQECINYAGHYYCNTLCSRGYQVIKDSRGGRHTCQDVDECSLSLHDCATGQRCDNLPGSFRCTRDTPCGTGYTVNGVTQECEDVDECALNIHDCDVYYTCNNTLGSFRCERCPSGFKSSQGINACNVDINECSDPNICRPGERCDNTYGGHRCTSLCAKGMEYISYLSRCMDIDECARGSHTCGPNQLCKNTMGSHSCQCKEGFSYDFATQTCNDLDECEEGKRLGRPKCRPHESCENIAGSHRCTPACPFGQRYTQNGNAWNCTDINECLEGTHNCRGGDEICVNDAYNGTYRCIRCIRGTVFNAAAKTCDDIDECNNPEGRVCIGICNNNPGSFYCTCPTGYNMIQSRVCRDIDECQVGTHRCRPDQLCFNTKGSHRCMNIQCPEYYNKRITNCIKEECALNDPECIMAPAIISHNFISMASNFRAPTMLYTLSTKPHKFYTKKFEIAFGNAGGEFYLEPDGDSATIHIKRTVEGPKLFELHVEIREYKRALLYNIYLSKVYFHVAELDF
ncbi:uncharacterized protein [Amphiura filiformis]|uniref:uncharacterized protein isoform X2 n=1 Tax=Amphiura filiformis TaxID=82378 RepID=UPI003B226413